MRKTTSFNYCRTHAHLVNLPRRRQAEFACEGGPTNGPCEGLGCSIKPGRDLFAESAEGIDFPSLWAVNRPTPAPFDFTPAPV